MESIQRPSTTQTDVKDISMKTDAVITQSDVPEHTPEKEQIEPTFDVPRTPINKKSSLGIDSDNKNKL